MGVPSSLPDKTNCERVEQYFKLYAGPKYSVDWKISMVVGLSFMPMLSSIDSKFQYLVTGVSILIFYIWQKIAIAYYYQEPGILHDDLSYLAEMFIQWGIPCYVMSQCIVNLGMLL